MKTIIRIIDLFFFGYNSGNEALKIEIRIYDEIINRKVQ